MENTSVLEVVWILLSLFGLVFSTANMAEAIRDWHVVRRSIPPDARHLIARQAVRVEGGRVLLFIVCALVGMIAAYFPPRPGGASVVQAALFILVILVFGLNSLMDLRVRKQVDYLRLTLLTADGEKLQHLVESATRAERTAEQVANDLAASIARADQAPNDVPGAGADAALRSSGMTAAEAAKDAERRDRRKDDQP